MANEIVAANFVLILVTLFLLIVILIFLIAIRRQIRNMGVGVVSPPIPEPSIPRRGLFNRAIHKMPPVPLEPQPQQPVVVERMEQEAARAVEKEHPIPPPAPKPSEPETFICKKCKKEFIDKKKLQRHIGMAHYKDLEI